MVRKDQSEVSAARERLLAAARAADAEVRLPAWALIAAGLVAGVLMGRFPGLRRALWKRVVRR